MGILSIGRNIRGLRDERNITQQQLAEAVNVSFQAVSKWECGTTIPDVATLIKIAEYFEITLDELIQPKMMIYANKADRLMAIYDSNRDNLEAFQAADKEYRKLFESGDYTDQDLGFYAIANEWHAHHHLGRAESYYLKAIEKGETTKGLTYYKNQRQYIGFLARIGRINEAIENHSKRLESEPDNVMNYSSLVCAYKWAGKLEKAIEVAEKGLDQFPDDAILLVYTGDTYKRLGRYEQALNCWDKAFKIDPEMIDTQYSLAEYLLEQQDYVAAKKVLQGIIDWNIERGAELDCEWVHKELDKIAKQ